MIDIVRSQTPHLLDSGKPVAAQVQRTLIKISRCQTPALGGHLYQCDPCSHQCVVYNSCADRHCPQCRGARRASWVDGAEGLLLDGIDYFQVVFTLPQELSSLALGNRSELYGLLFRAAWKALSKTLKDEHDLDPAASMVLHTWNQKLEHHPHVHAVVPGAGPSQQGDRWVTCRRQGDGAADGGGGRYLVDADRLRQAWRAAFLKGLDQLYRQGQLKLDRQFAGLRDRQRWQAWLQELAEINWVSFIQPPPTPSAQPGELVRYLARYLTGGPISDRRILSVEDGRVTFLARQGTTPGGEARQVPMSLSVSEFVRRWAMHILPRGFTKVRRYGGWHNRRCETYLERCAIMIEDQGIALPETATDFEPSDFEPSDLEEFDSVACEKAGGPPCPHCDRPMRLVAVLPRHWRPQKTGNKPPDAIEFAGSQKGSLVRPLRDVKPRPLMPTAPPSDHVQRPIYPS